MLNLGEKNTTQEYKNQYMQFCLMFSTEVKLGLVKLREKRKLRDFKNLVLRIMFWIIMDEVTGE